MVRKRKIEQAALLLFVVVFLFVMLAPLAYMVSASFMSQADLNSIPPKLFPSAPSLANFVSALTQQPILKYVYNSFVITDCSCNLPYRGKHGILRADPDTDPV